ncbi:MAG TPA: NAD(P)H-hydrate dehydratase [Blastocatellia bacterium]|jgi:hydroxyethylthiazole kinase-like uncharacterized protein yjeF|nr:NAD(P)H-hydrate dehydratase [Blastocatellia bacterium]
MKSKAGPSVLTDRFMRGWALPQPLEEGDKEERGRVLVIGGAPEMPGAAVLAATAALRAGAGKLRIATCRSIAPFVAIALPEARVFAMPETRRGGIALSGSADLAKQAGQVNAVLIGPGLVDKTAVDKLMRKLIPLLKDSLVVLDAAALSFLRQEPESLRGLGGRVILTPHAGEMADLLRVDKEEIARARSAFAKEAAELFRAVVVLKGAETHIATPEGAVYLNRSGNVGLATSGSGDTLAGIIAGLAARGAEPAQASAWATYLHGRAGDRLAKKIGRLGFLARELLAEIPILMSGLDPGRK